MAANLAEILTDATQGLAEAELSARIGAESKVEQSGLMEGQAF